jgi:hypothetical protein
LKRGVFDILRRAADNTLANWPLLLLRLGEMLFFGALTIVAVLAAFVPILVSVGIEFSRLSSIDNIGEAMMALLDKWILLVWIFVVLMVLMEIFMAVHSFVEAGSARVYLDAERAAGEGPGVRSRFRLFSMERWLAGGKDGWWSVFWIYHLAWTVGGLILLIPLVPTALLELLFFRQEQQPLAVGTGCIGLIVSGLLFIAVAVGVGMWTNRSIASWAVRRAGARDALSAGWQAVRSDLGRHLGVMLAILVVGLAGSTFLSSFSFFAAFGDAMGHRHTFDMVTFPLRMIGSLLNTALSVVIAAWYLAAYSGMAAED